MKALVGSVAEFLAQVWGHICQWFMPAFVIWAACMYLIIFAWLLPTWLFGH